MKVDVVVRCTFVWVLFMVLDAKNPKPVKFIELKKVIPSIVLDIRYATTKNFTGKKVYSSSRCFLVEKAALALKKVQLELNKSGLGLKVFDGYRPFSVQEIFWKMFPDRRYVAMAKRGKDGLPISGSKHNRGTAVDVTIINIATGIEQEMPSDFDDFSEKSHIDYAGASELAKVNCEKLRSIMSEAGFEQAKTEWWHFNFKRWQKYPLCDKSFKELDSESKLKTASKA